MKKLDKPIQLRQFKYQERNLYLDNILNRLNFYSTYIEQIYIKNKKNYPIMLKS